MPRLPVEIDPAVSRTAAGDRAEGAERRPVAAMRLPRDGADLTRYLEGRPVIARPSQYSSARSPPASARTSSRRRLAPAPSWSTPHEADSLRTATAGLDRRDDDWIGESRALVVTPRSPCTSARSCLNVPAALFYFGAHRFYEGSPHHQSRSSCSAAVHRAHGRPYARAPHNKAVARRVLLGGVSLLPLFL